ncbi:MAG: hypothetical protein J6563_01195 [Gilliamella sp.]|uniref:hypothetical protein n=1 Tax=Gilliamella sp. TaxID=1891236 RepID=UPI0026042179|nr:hypothetical protein [Gilliamella sp.]MCO6551578.1 hypothetical protein [Gilliamella sp.]MCO6559900.1 hypothetical protein [Gilliamella sp.]
MIKKFLLSTILFTFSYCAYGQLLDINPKYRGDPFFISVNMQQLKQDCAKNEDEYNQLNKQDKLRYDNRCPLNNLKFDFKQLDKLINDDPFVYNGNDFQLKLSINPINPKIKNEDNLPNLGRDITLSLISKNQVIDKLFLANNSFSNNPNLWNGYQHYYIAPSGDIYTLLTIKAEPIEDESGTFPTLWKHYNIDASNMKFELKEMLIEMPEASYQIIYPNQFNTNSHEGAVEYGLTLEESIALFNQSVKNGLSDYSLDFRVYRYYQDQLKEKIKLFDNKKQQQDSLLSLQQNINTTCLITSAPIYESDIEPYLDKVLTCLIDQYRQAIKHVEDELAN